MKKSVAVCVKNCPEPICKVHPGDIMIHFTAPEGFAKLGVKENNQNAIQDTGHDTVHDTEQDTGHDKRKA